MVAQHRKRPAKPDISRLITVSVAALLILALIVAAGVAWFSLPSAEEKDLVLGVGKVSYTVPEENELFYSSFELEEIYEDPFDEDDQVVPADPAHVTVLLSGEPITPDGEGIYRVSLPEEEQMRLQLSLLPLNPGDTGLQPTDKITYVSSTPLAVSVSPYGLMRGIGTYDDPTCNTSVITVTAQDRTLDPVTRRADIVITVAVTITENSEPGENAYGYLPGERNILKTPLTVSNLSTVPSKLRLKLTWEYKDYTAEDTAANARVKYAASDLLTASSHLENVLLPLENGERFLTSPAIIAPAEGFRFVPAAADVLAMRDENGNTWKIETLSLLPNELNALQAALADGTGATTFTLSELMIDKASICVCYSQNAITDASTDYGTALPKDATGALAGNPDATGTEYTAITSITSSKNYASFSTRKVFSMTVTVQARQAAFYEESAWFDVYCVHDHTGG